MVLIDYFNNKTYKNFIILEQVKLIRIPKLKKSETSSFNFFSRHSSVFNALSAIATVGALLVSIYVMLDQKRITNINLKLSEIQTEVQQDQLKQQRQQHTQDSISNEIQSLKQDSISKFQFYYQDSIYKNQNEIQKAELAQFVDQASIARQQYETSLQQIKKSDDNNVREFNYQDSINKIQYQFDKSQLSILSSQNHILASQYNQDSIEKIYERENTAAVFRLSLKSRYKIVSINTFFRSIKRLEHIKVISLQNIGKRSVNNVLLIYYVYDKQQCQMVSMDSANLNNYFISGEKFDVFDIIPSQIDAKLTKSTVIYFEIFFNDAFLNRSFRYLYKFNRDGNKYVPELVIHPFKGNDKDCEPTFPRRAKFYYGY